MPNPLLQDAEWLRSRYEDQQMTLQEIADEAGVPNGNKTTVRRALMRHGIEVRSVSEGKRGRSIAGVAKTPEWRAKIAESRRGFKASDETREKIRQASTGRAHTAETRSRLAELRQGENNPMYGKPSPGRGPDYTPDDGEARRRRMRKHRFGLSQADYERMLTEQHSKCAICGKLETRAQGGRISALAVDHCHRTMKVRGLLCSRCNAMLGFVNDDPEILRAAINYLDRFTC